MGIGDEINLVRLNKEGRTDGWNEEKRKLDDLESVKREN